LVEIFNIFFGVHVTLSHGQLFRPAKRDRELDVHGFPDGVDGVPWAILDHRQWLPLWNLRHGHASLAKHL